MNTSMALVSFGLLCIGGGAFGVAFANAGASRAFRRSLVVGIYATGLAIWVAIHAVA